MNPQSSVVRRTVVSIGVALLAALCLGARAAAPSRGELLYTTHCIACHSTQMHWRDQRLATDLDSLKQQVRLWQGRAMLSWTEDDIDEVTRYLNQRIYRFGRTVGAGASVHTQALPDPAHGVKAR